MGSSAPSSASCRRKCWKRSGRWGARRMPRAEAITIVIPCRNEAGCIAEVLDSVLAQDLAGSDWEVIVADGMSDDGTRAILDAYAARQPRIRVRDNPARAVPAGLNAALRAAR